MIYKQNENAEMFVDRILQEPNRRMEGWTCSIEKTPFKRISSLIYPSHVILTISQDFNEEQYHRQDHRYYWNVWSIVDKEIVGDTHQYPYITVITDTESECITVWNERIDELIQKNRKLFEEDAMTLERKRIFR